ncbi:MAG: hypothetical protein OEV87_09600 [Phycisphaerae bacterium]|nr:hypothetical protein [Phycisphaerae bacterium]
MRRIPMGKTEHNRSDASCSFADQCGLVETLQAKMAELSQRIYEKYCTNPSSQCARRWLYEQAGPRAVPSLMLPGQFDWAHQIAEELNGDPVSEHAEAQ